MFFLVSCDLKNMNMKGKELRLVLFGKIGLGKSVIVNIIFGKCLFKLIFLGILIIWDCV